LTLLADHDVTEEWKGPEEILQKSLVIMNKIRFSYNLCTDSSGPKTILFPGPIKEAYMDLKRRGIKVRMITEITNDNLADTKEFMKMAEVRHLERILGNFVIADTTDYAGSPETVDGILTKLMVSNVSAFVKQQQYFFEMLWEKAIPADQRIRELEAGVKPETLELIHDTRKSIALAFEIMNRTKQELLILFATPHTFSLGLSMGSADVYYQMSKKGVNIRILVPKGSQVEEEVAKMRVLNPSLNLRISDADLNTRITIMVADRKEIISWELKDDTLSDPYEAGGIATYSNIQSLATSYGTIFDNLWKITEFTENLKMANVKLEKSEKSMKEFMDVAAHELRTPIQPIIGLAEVLRDTTKDPTQSTLLDAIIRNAERLQRLQEDILDVTKIENQLISYEKEIFNIDGVIAQVVIDVEKSSTGYDAPVIITDLHSNSIVKGDKQRIVQVVLNLLGNSLKFTKKGTINISSRRQDSEVLVSVRDTGMGIDPEMMPKLFVKFATKSPTGTGLGLFISKSIIEGHGGKIWAENNEGNTGATFSFTLPLSPSA
jgi:signal transduction histidine kinase